MKVLTADQILNCDDLNRELVEVPEWGGSVYVRALTGTERDQFEADIISTKGKKSEINYANLRAKLVALTACDETGTLVFDSTQVKKLGGKSAAALDKCFSVAQKLNGMSAQDVDDLTKN